MSAVYVIEARDREHAEVIADEVGAMARGIIAASGLPGGVEVRILEVYEPEERVRVQVEFAGAWAVRL